MPLIIRDIQPHRPLLHAMVSYGLRNTYGVEIDSIKVSKAEAFVRQAAEGLALRCSSTNSRRSGTDGEAVSVSNHHDSAPLRGLPVMTCAAIEQVGCTGCGDQLLPAWGKRDGGWGPG